VSSCCGWAPQRHCERVTESAAAVLRRTERNSGRSAVRPRPSAGRGARRVSAAHGAHGDRAPAVAAAAATARVCGATRPPPPPPPADHGRVPRCRSPQRCRAKGRRRRRRRLHTVRGPARRGVACGSGSGMWPVACGVACGSLVPVWVQGAFLKTLDSLRLLAHTICCGDLCMRDVKGEHTHVYSFGLPACKRQD